MTMPYIRRPLIVLVWPCRRSCVVMDNINDGQEVEVPRDVIRWTNPWTTWGRGISTYGLPDTKTWDGVGHDEKQSYGRRMSRREKKELEGLEEEEE